MYILECDDSQSNILANNDWEGTTPSLPWTQNTNCASGVDIDVYSGIRHTSYFKNILPGHKI